MQRPLQQPRRWGPPWMSTRLVDKARRCLAGRGGGLASAKRWRNKGAQHMQERGKVQARNIGLDPGLPGLDLSSFEPEQGALGSPEEARPNRPPFLGRKSLGDMLTWDQEGLRNAWPVKPARNWGDLATTDSPLPCEETALREPSPPLD